MSIYVNYVKIFLPKFFAKHFDEWGKEAPNYEADFEKGIPAQKYGALSEKLSGQNTAVAQVMRDYVLNADELQKCNNIRQSLFSQKLDEFLNIK